MIECSVDDGLCIFDIGHRFMVALSVVVREVLMLWMR